MEKIIFLFAGLITLLSLMYSEQVYARKVVCIDSASYGRNSFSANHEGWEWQNSHAGDIIEVAGKLDSCLKKVQRGDTLVIITHGFPGGFTWGGQDYDGFGNDTGAANPHPLPPGFDTVTNVFVKFCSCFSAYSDDSTRSVVDKIIEALGGGAGGGGFENSAWAENCYMISGGTPAQRAAAKAALMNNMNWAKLPPPNRIPPTVPNQITDGQRIIDSALGGRHVVVNSIYYKPPKDTILPVSTDCGGNAIDIMDVTPDGIMLEENFSYPASDSLGAYGWINFSGGIVNRFTVVPGSIGFPNYPLSGIGNQTIINNTGQDNYKDLYYGATTGAVYAYFLVVIMNATPGGDYFAAYLPSTSTTNFEGRVFVRNQAGMLAFGISKSTDPPQYGPPMFNMGQPLLVVLKYQFNTGSATDDLISLFVYNNFFPPTEPPPYAGPITGTVADLPDIQRFAIRQGNATNAPTLAFDGLKVAQSWNTTVLNVNLALQGFYNPISNNHSLSDTFTVELHNNISPYQLIDVDRSVVNASTLKGTFEFLNVPTGNFFMVVRHRNGLETWTGSPLAVTRGGTYPYDFRTSASQAFGNNMILKSSTYCLYNGDIDQDGVIDGTDGALVDNAAFNFVTGYVPEDCDGNNFVDGSDGAIVDNNASNFVVAITPLSLKDRKNKFRVKKVMNR